MNGDDLNDGHINFAQYLLLTQFPTMRGLVLTLLQEKKLPQNYLQAVYKSFIIQGATTGLLLQQKIALEMKSRYMIHCIGVQMLKYAR